MVPGAVNGGNDPTNGLSDRLVRVVDVGEAVLQDRLFVTEMPPSIVNDEFDKLHLGGFLEGSIRVHVQPERRKRLAQLPAPSWVLRINNDVQTCHPVRQVVRGKVIGN